MPIRKKSNTRRPRVALPGERYGLLVVVGDVGRDHRNIRQVRAKCDCGGHITVRPYNMRCGDTRSCGCLVAEKNRQMFSTHGRSRTQEYRAWRSLIVRCTDAKHASFPNYGGRGITVCHSWMGPGGFEAFYADMGSPPTNRHSIDRVDNMQGYMPSNCRWATRAEQSRNKRDNVFLTHDGCTMCVTDWAAKTGINRYALYQRMAAGWTTERALTTPVRGTKK